MAIDLPGRRGPWRALKVSTASAPRRATKTAWLHLRESRAGRDCWTVVHPLPQTAGSPPTRPSRVRRLPFPDACPRPCDRSLLTQFVRARSTPRPRRLTTCARRAIAPRRCVLLVEELYAEPCPRPLRSGAPPRHSFAEAQTPRATARSSLARTLSTCFAHKLHVLSYF
jgi:hypothetical protein